MKEIKIGIIGMTEGNGHPYSWSAIINGNYNQDEMKKCGYQVIVDYLLKEPKENWGIPGARVTHVYTDDPADAVKVSRASLIPNIVDKPEDLIGNVDAVIIATDIGSQHVERARPFIEAGLPLFIDKPLADNEKDLKIFIDWVNEGKKILSSSAMRYVPSYEKYKTSELKNFVGEIRFVNVNSPKKWETYGIHALETVYQILKPGFTSVRNTGTYEKNIVHIKHSSGADLIIAVIYDMFCEKPIICGTKGCEYLNNTDTTYIIFKEQLEAAVEYFRTGERPFPFEETIELMKLVIAGIKSREQNGNEIFLKDILI
ncbi:MAG: Gfo/Idh/MocA family oxidoreductase [Proteobacteria bacterium]|nr:Gfo/Idh/MocA family oxidoreductase [Pseudomonadota bacterium]